MVTSTPGPDATRRCVLCDEPLESAQMWFNVHAECAGDDKPILCILCHLALGYEDYLAVPGQGYIHYRHTLEKGMSQVMTDHTNPYVHVNNFFPVHADGEDALEITMENCIVTREVAAAMFTLTLNGQKFNFAGSSRRNHHDHFDPEVAVKLAYGRALRDIAKHFLTQGHGKAKHNDDQRELNRKKRDERRKNNGTTAKKSKSPEYRVTKVAMSPSGVKKKKATKSSKKAVATSG